MAKKIKKRSKRRDEEPEDAEIVSEETDLEDEEDEDVGFGEALVEVPEDERDRFEDGTIRALDWAERNQGMFAVLAIAAIAVPFLVFAGLQVMESSAMSKSEAATPVFTSYNTPVLGSEELDQYEKGAPLEKFKRPTKSHASLEAKWQAVYDASNKASGTEAVSQAAKLSKAASAYQLGKFDEAVTLYQDLRKSDAPIKPFVLFGLGQSLQGKGDFDGAVGVYDELAGLQEEYAALGMYHKGRALEDAKKVKEAKDVYHKLVEAHPKSPFKADVDRRLATL